jgi:hypothetical protein
MLAAQEAKCLICLQIKELVIDHCYVNGHVRGYCAQAAMRALACWAIMLSTQGMRYCISGSEVSLSRALPPTIELQYSASTHCCALGPASLQALRTT